MSIMPSVHSMPPEVWEVSTGHMICTHTLGFIIIELLPFIICHSCQLGHLSHCVTILLFLYVRLNVFVYVTKWFNIGSFVCIHKIKNKNKYIPTVSESSESESESIFIYCRLFVQRNKHKQCIAFSRHYLNNIITMHKTY